MPKEGAMTQISRPFQIALAALVLFIAVWFVALRGHSSGGGSSSSPASASSAPTAAASTPSGGSAAAQSAPGGGSPASQGGVYHGAAPGVEGLSRAIQKARGAVAQSQRSAKRHEAAASAAGGLQKQGAQAHGPTEHSQARTTQSSGAQRSQAQQRQSRHAQNARPTKAASGAPAMQRVVEAELERGKIVAVLFWNPKGAVDATVRRELRAASRARHGRLAVHVARASEVGSFGSFTNAVQVYSTPTILLINADGKTASVTGLTDAFSIGQAIREVKLAK
jgi:hypothetical protein